MSQGTARHGVLVCGGGVLNGTVLEPSAACNRVSLTGQVTQAADMPGPRMGHAMLTLSDGTVLLTGGIDSSTSEGETKLGISTASVYVPREDDWEQIGPMQLRRIGHKLVDSGDGRVFAIGGADSGDLRNTLGTARDCGELFDPGSFQWTSFAECGTTGEGYGLAVASRPEHGALVVTGLGEGSTDNGTYGWLGFGPPLLPAE